jgi:hypothetical protein
MTADNPQPAGHENEIGVLWGCEEIGAAIGCNPRRTHYLLDQGQLPGAKKVGGRWCISRRRLRDIFEGTLQ